MAMSKPWCDCQRQLRTVKGEVKKWYRWCKAAEFSEDIVYDEMDNRPFLSTTLTTGQEVLNVGKAVQLYKNGADFGRTVFGTLKTKIAS